MTAKPDIGRQIVAIWLPSLAMERHQRQAAQETARNAAQPDALPLALTAEGPHGPVLTAVNAAAQAQGISAAMRLTDARALCPALTVAPGDAEGDSAALQALGLWAERWSPWVAIDPWPATHGLVLDVTGGAHLFGGVDGLLGDMQRRLGGLGLSTRIALAPTLGAAWALARHISALSRRRPPGDFPPISCPPGQLSTMLTPLPVAGLRLDDKTITLLRRLGLKTIGSLAAMPREALARRFRKTHLAEANPLLRLDQALGRSAETLAPLTRPAPYRAMRQVLEPIRHLVLVEAILSDLAAELAAGLAASNRGARRLVFRAWRVDGHVAAVEAELAAPSRDPVHFIRLFAGRFDALDAGFGFDQFVLQALRHEALTAHQVTLAGDDPAPSALPQLMDRLIARLGKSAVRRALPRASHIPERSVSWQSPLDAAPASQHLLALHDRPLKLLLRPEPIAVVYATPEGMPRRFRWRQQTHDIVRSAGPERIAPEWWRERGTARLRDYYSIEDERGERYWIYRQGLVDDGRGGAPDWFIHGLFG